MAEASSTMLVNPARHDEPAPRPRWLIVVALVCGAMLCALWYLTLPRLMPRPRSGIQSALWSDLGAQCGVVVIAGLLAWMPFSHRLLQRAFDRARRPSKAARAVTAAMLGGAAAFYCYCNAVFQQRTMLPFWHDEMMHRVQTQILAEGHLWMPAHPLAKFFESFYLFTTPVYTPNYFPGTAMLHVPGVWMGLPYFAIPLCIAGATAALLYLVVTKLLDGVSGILAVLVLVSVRIFRMLSLMEMSHAAMLMWELLFFWLWLAWRENPKARWIWLAGAVAGWAAITRPVDAACIVLPLSLGWGFDLIKRQGARGVATALVMASLAAAPFIAIQLALDYGVTGHVLHSPLGEYDHKYFQNEGLGFHKPDPNFRPPVALPQFQLIYRYFLYPMMAIYTPADAFTEFFRDRLPTAVNAMIASSFLLPLLAAGVLGLRTRARAAFCAIAPLFMLAMVFYFIFLDHYCATMVAGIIVLMLLGAEVIVTGFKSIPQLRIAVPLAIAGLAILGLPGISGRIEYSTRNRATMEMNYHSIPTEVELPAIVLFRFDTPNLGAFHEEPVYNWDVAWPDQAQIIRAHDLGDQNIELFRYYAAKQPDRHVYIFDRGDFTLKSLGRVADLAQSTPQSAHSVGESRSKL
ncbi:MAG TPA: hypothetical protein VH370_13590 [Humisphaera sp.]|nr:hypothetical protein [Humisphaera sp.]